MAQDYTSRWAEITKKPVDAQTKFFLRAFVIEFQGKFETVLDICDQYKNYAPQGVERSSLAALPEFECHLFLEKRGETLTVRALRENLKAEIKLTSDHQVAFVEYLLWKYKKTLAQLFTPPPEGAVNQKLLALMDQAIESYLSTKEAERVRREELEKLKVATDGAKRSVASVQAKNKMQELEGQEFSGAFAQMQALRKKREAEEALARAPKVDPYVEEQKRLAEEKRRKEEEDKKKKDESRDRLKARAALWN
eukprot:TRINITY_DN10300_c0_g1_i1.p1 TRINITY_DN10300_c0_g1~~TRINITY_DN10300_c0_g1_i1.p1  ORF type:complete len:252 (-),score=83.97 TRINITY_DN10300_c0_g1_i1:26-781(-)